MTHYEILGVLADATQDDLKRAFRRQAESAHPDKGGDHARMSAINLAYEVLSDPQRRLLYDSTGSDKQYPMDEQVRTAIMSAFNDALSRDAPDALAYAKKFIDTAQSEMDREQKRITEKRDKLASRRDRVSRKSGANAFHLIIDQQIASFDQELARIANNLEVCKGAARELKDYASTEIEVVRQMPSYVYLGAIGTATGKGNY